MAVIKAVIFDLDGTLLDTLDDIADSFNTVMREMGFPGHTVENYRMFIGEGARTATARIVPPGHRDNETVSECLRRYRQLYNQTVGASDSKTHVYPGVGELLTVLASRGIPRAICSNKPHDQVVACAGRFLNGHRFDHLWGSVDGVPLKPSPVRPLEIAASLGIEPASIIFCGDSGIDMATACAAGMIPVGVLWGFRTRDELVNNGARILCEKPLDMISHLS